MGDEVLAMKILIWFHRDMRTHDHAGLSWALSQGHEVIGLAFSPQLNSSAAKIKFWHETATNLAKNLQNAGIAFEISDENPIDKIPVIVETHKIDKIITHRRMNFRDRKELELVAQKLSIEVTELGDLTLFNYELSHDLTLKQLRPFTGFKNLVVQNYKVPDALVRAQKIKLIDQLDLDWSAGGEAAGLMHLEDYIWKTQAVAHYHETRNGMIKRDDSSKFSRWLALGALSPRYIYQELKHLEKKIGPSEGISALIYELIWRDYFKFLALIIGESFFSKQGLRNHPLDCINDPHLFEYWCKGETSDDFVDANMRELLLTGWMSNRGRQNVASYFAKIINLDWTLGAQWFEQQLIDDDPENNWGNWQYIAGVGTDPRDRRFDMKKQAAMYDPEGIYQAQWLGSCKALEKRILELLAKRSLESTICPSEILNPAEKKNKQCMEEVRSAARRLSNMGLINFFQKGEKVNPLETRGPIRLKRCQQT